jgi:tripartite-type tricarboxylate transporter receptor subunit TctC
MTDVLAGNITMKFDSGFDPIGNTPEEFSAQILREREKWAKVVKEAGIKPE